MESSGASSSSSAPRKRKREDRKHDVFLSFRGEDTRYGFTGFLYDSLVREGLNAYRDDEKLRIGKRIRSELLEAIEESKSAIVILSENYAGSTWCLDELAKIVECVETRDLILYPVFYKVDPSDVRSQRKQFDLTKLYEADSGITKDRVDSWTTALRQVGNSVGHHVKEDGYETNARDEIVGKISKELKHTSMRNLELPITDLVLGKTFEANCEKVLECLKNNQISKIGIYGMGGVGKTTLMKHVYNQILADEATFGGACWVSVSHDFSIRGLQHDIFKKLDCDFPSDDDEMSRAASLYAILKEKGKYILILDDVWDNIPLDDVGIPVDVNSCNLIVTTRSLDVCNRMFCGRNIKISPLLRDEAWELFKKINLGQEKEFTPEVETTAKDVASMCGGLPLAIKAMAGSMRGFDDICEWRNALEELKKPATFIIDGMESDVLKILKYSYDRLRDEESQLCFLSCALYPEDYNIRRRELIDYCIVKGLIGKRDSRRAEIDKGHTMLNKLERYCLLEHVQYGWLDNLWEGKCVKMHDLMREMALHIMNSGKEQVMVKAGLRLTEIPEDKEWKKDLEVVSLIGNDIRVIRDGRSPRCRKLSTLMLNSNEYLNSISDSFFVHMCNLKVLNLRNNRDLRRLPNSVGNLKNLNALWLGDCINLLYIPSLRKLKKLSDLELSGTHIEEVPGGVGELRSLRCLRMDRSVSIEELMKLQQLEVFRGRVQGVSDYNVFLRSNWFQQLSVYDMFVSKSGNVGCWDTSEDLLVGGEYINKLRLVELNLGGVVDVPCGIKRLAINNCKNRGKCLLEFGLWGKNAGLRELKSIDIRFCEEVEWVVAMPSSSTNVQFPSIEKLRIFYMKNMKGIFNWWEYCDSTTSTTIPEPIPIPSRVGGGDYNQSSFPGLKLLHINGCPKLKVGLTMNCLMHLPVLEELRIFDCLELEEIIGGGEDHHENHNTRNITLPKLKRLCLIKLPSLNNIYNNGNIICDSIEEITLKGCRKLKRLPLTTTTTTSSLCSSESSRPLFPSLKKIYIKKSQEEWWKLLELVHPTYHSLLRPFLRLE